MMVMMMMMTDGCAELAGGNQSTQRKPNSLPLYSPQTPTLSDLHCKAGN
jgi:hypothetical protein